MAQLRLIVFGPPRLERDGEALELSLRRAMALLVYLAVTRQPQSRDALATLIWPDSDQREARANLRRMLHRLGQVLGDDVLTTSAETVSIAPGTALAVDAHAFARLAAAGERLEDAVALYGDDFLAGFTLPDSPAFDEWQFFERERLRQLFAQTLEHLVQRARSRGAWDVAADYARRWVALDVLHEPAQRALLEAYGQSGQVAAAQRQYQELARVLGEELGAEPEEATRALYDAIRGRRLPAPARPPGGGDGGGPEAPRPAQLPPAPPLIGREHELEEIQRILTTPGGARLVTLLGPGGVGKTRLAQAIVEWAGARFGDGAYLVALADVAVAQGIAPAIAARLGLPGGDGERQAQLLGALRDRELLLVLDCFEHLLDGAALVAAILGATTRARIVVTSRERLDLGEEAVFPLVGLDLPAEEVGAAALDAPAARLLLQRARLVRPELALDPAEVAAIARICRLVQGMPLALTLAASWAELLSFAEIAGEIARDLDFLATGQRDVAERQRSMRAVFEGSWRRLPADAQRVFARLTVFRGSFTRPAAEVVARADLHALRRLVNTSFITLSAHAQRYAIHELLRQFAEGAVAGELDVAAARHRHAALYLDLVRGLTVSLKSAGQRQAVLTLAADADNLRAAWSHAAAQGQRAALAGAAEGLWLFYEFSGDPAAGEAAFGEALAALEGAAGGPDDPLVGLLLAAHGHFQARRGVFARGEALMERGVALMRAAPSQLPLGLALVYLGFLARYRGDQAAAQRLGEESLALFAEADDHWGVALSLELMGTALARQGRPVLAQQLLQSCVETARAAGAYSSLAVACWALAQLLAGFGDYPAAQRMLDEAVAVGQAAGYRLPVATAVAERAFLALDMGDLDAAERAFAESIALYEAAGSAVFAEATRGHAGILARLRGDAAQAEALLQRGLEHARASHNRRDQALLLGELGLLAADRGDPRGAARLQAEALAHWRALENEPWVAAASAMFAATSVGLGAPPAETEALLRTALSLAARHRLAPTALLACVSLASHLAAQGERVTPLELLALAESHPAATFETRRRAAALAAELAAAVAPEEAAAARGRGAGLDWRAVAARFTADPASADLRHQPALTNLDTELAPLVGRDFELGQLVGLLGGSARRLVTLLGPGGIGKTRLAQEAALAMLDSYADGAFFVGLAPLDAPAQLVAAIAEPLGLRLSGAGEPRDQLLRFLGRRQLLLVLDNFEQLREEAELIPAILRAAPRVTILVTSRERLGLDGELVYTLGGIEVPAGEDDERAMERGAVRLLLLRVRQIRPAFDPGPRDLDALIRIARLVQGMPLALILAASWADMLALDEIAAEIERGLDVLEADLRALPPRQRSVRAVFDVSWRRLTPAAQACFARMSVFRGGFSRHAAERIAGADLRMLRALVNSSFLSPDRDGRYAVHELMRQFGAEHLAAEGEAEALLDRHSAYYLELLRDLEPDLRRRRQAEAFLTIEGDLDNIRQAWGRAADQGAGGLVGEASHALFLFSYSRGRFREGGDLFQQARERLAPAPPGPGDLWLRLTTRLSLLRSLFPPEQQVPVSEVERCQALARERGQRFEEALAAFASGMYYTRTENDYARALALFEAALQQLRSLDDRFHLAEALARYAICRGYTGDLAAFYTSCREGSEVARADENSVGLLIAQGNLSEALLHLGRYREIIALGEQQIALGERLGARNAIALALQFMAVAHFLEGDLEASHRTAVRGYEVSAAIQSALAMGNSLALQCLQASVGGDFALARRFAEEALAHPLNLLGLVHVHLGDAIALRGVGDHAGARRALGEALRSARRFATFVPTLLLLPVAALLLADEGRREDAATLLARAHTHPLSPGAWLMSWRALGEVRTGLEGALGPAAFAAAWDSGARLEDAAATALLAARFG